MMRKNKIYEKLLEIVNKNYGLMNGLMNLMKLSFVIAIVALAYFAMPAAAEANIVVNPDFESGTTAPLYWRLMDNNGNMPLWDSTVSHTGSRSIKISIPGTTSGYSGKAESDFMYVEPGQNYTFSAWVKTLGTGGNPPIVTVVEADANTNWLRSTRLTFGTGTNDWSQQVIDFQTGPDTAILYVTAKISDGYGTFWVDDISISPKGATTYTPAPAPTSMPTPLPTSSSGKIYYVAKNGNDNNLGTELSPWLTIQKAANTAKAGDTVYVKAGTYIEWVKFPNSGTDGNYITFQNYSMDNVTVKAPIMGYPSYTQVTPQHHSGQFEMVGKSYIKIKGFLFTGSGTTLGYAPDAVIVAELGAHHIIVEGNRFENLDTGGVWLAGYYRTDAYAAWNLTFTNNYVTNPIAVAARRYMGGANELISFDNVNYPDVSHNVFENVVSGIVVDYKDKTSNGIISYNTMKNVYWFSSSNAWTGYRSLAVYIDGYEYGANNIQVFNNFAKTASGFSVGSECGGLVQNVKFYNNILIDGYEGFQVPDWNNPNNAKCGGKTPNYLNIQFYNNVVYNSALVDGFNVGYWFKIQKSQSDIILRNNIGYGTGRNSYSSGITQDHNSWNLGITDPKFVNAAASDFHLQSNSPAIDVGSSLAAPEIDYDGNPRPKGGGYDLGAFEN